MCFNKFAHKYCGIINLVLYCNIIIYCKRIWTDKSIKGANLAHRSGHCEASLNASLDLRQLPLNTNYFMYIIISS